ncbi:MAG: 6-phosphofructokinase [Eubacteriales bacterium]|nr:6-phosphofructokinase [Eubacteriales bacterium]MDD4390354.1 6-phosphofructokinase [Eubacteriales bacterium]
MKTIGILTSGGDSPGMNAVIRAVVRTALSQDMKVYGINYGYEGLIEGKFQEMNISSVSDILHKGGTILKTARSERFPTEEGRQKAYGMIKTFGLDGMVIIGGDGSYRGGLMLSKMGLTVMCIPGTIDNDLGYTDYTIGFDTAVNTVLGAISNIRDTSSSHQRTSVIEVMGRNCGDIALYAGLTGGAESILVPEKPVDINAVCRKVVQGINRGKLHSIIVKAEGVDLGTQELADIIQERTGQETKIVVLGYVQRGGSPTARDRMLASKMGYKAARLLMYEPESKAIGISGGEIIAYNLEDALEMNREFDDTALEIVDILSK